MSANPFQPPASTLDPEVGLGPVLLSCRDRSDKEVMRALGQSLLPYYFMPLVIPFPLAGLALMGIEKLGYKLSREAVRGLLAATYLVFGGWFYWRLFHRPRTTSLVLHAQGVRYKQLIVPFDDLAAIRCGGKLSGFQSAALKTTQVLGKVSRQNAAAAALIERSREGSMTLVYRTGDEKSVAGMQIRPEPADLARFFDQLRALRPDLVEESPASPPGRDDLPWTGPTR